MLVDVKRGVRPALAFQRLLGFERLGRFDVLCDAPRPGDFRDAAEVEEDGESLYCDAVQFCRCGGTYACEAGREVFTEGSEEPEALRILGPSLRWCLVWRRLGLRASLVRRRRGLRRGAVFPCCSSLGWDDDGASAADAWLFFVVFVHEPVIIGLRAAPARASGQRVGGRACVLVFYDYQS